MCGRYQFTAEQCEEIIRIAKAIDEKYGAGAWSPGEIRPTNRAPVLVVKDGEVRPELQTWGYKLPDSLVINARAKTAAEKPMFRDSVADRRCVIPSEGFFEWDKEKWKYHFRLPGEDDLYMAGLFTIKNGESNSYSGINRNGQTKSIEGMDDGRISPRAVYAQKSSVSG